MRRLGLPEDKEMEIARRSLLYLAKVKEFTRPPAFYASYVQRIVQEVTGSEDPFREQKALANRIALGILPDVERGMEGAEDRLAYALKVSAVGNSIDFAIRKEFDPAEEIPRLMALDFEVWDYGIFRERLSSARSVLIVGDNAGEIVFDKPLVRLLGEDGKEVIYAVKGEPILNDATLEDAAEVSMSELCRVISNGSGMVGTWLEDCSPEFLEIFRGADLVISKGQANFETLNSSGREIFFLLVAKCDPVAVETGSRPGRFVLLHRSP